ncbi:MAG TPA: hypothetical protein VMT43_06575, partial [Acidimicrobiales bacterium]|nr:hypothetical protein [Acidimicrobiales bacterium]
MDRPTDAIDLPSGAWVALRDTRKLTQGQREEAQIAWYAVSAPVRELMKARQSIDEGDLEGIEQADRVLEEATGPEDMRALFHLNRVISATVIAAWSFDAPVSPEAIRDLSAEDYDAVLKAGAQHSNEVLAGVDFTPTRPGEESPTGPA